jgi:hypothetical protein
LMTARGHRGHRVRRLSPLILRSRASGVSKDEADLGASWFEMARSRLLTMRVLTP